MACLLALIVSVEGIDAKASLSGAFPEWTEPTPMLNHETSDHLLSLVEARVTGFDATFVRPRDRL